MTARGVSSSRPLACDVSVMIRRSLLRLQACQRKARVRTPLRPRQGVSAPWRVDDMNGSAEEGADPAPLRTPQRLQGG